MAHFAKIENNIVIDVNCIVNEVIKDYDVAPNFVWIKKH